MNKSNISGHATKNHLISVVMPTYNRRRYIGEAVQSVLDQTYNNWELIIVDDGSTDDTGEYLKSTFNDSRIKYFFQKNKGQSAARNLGINHTQGDLIAFLDSDNRWLPGKLEKQVALFEKNPEFDVIYGNNRTINEDGRTIRTTNPLRYSGNILRHLLANNFISMNTVLVRKNNIMEIGCFNEQNRWDEDYELWLNMALQSKFLFVPEFFGEYRISPGQISDNIQERTKANEKLITSFLEAHADIITPRDRKNALYKFYASWAYLCREEGRRKEALSHYVKALKYNPGQLRIVLAMLKTCYKKMK